MKAAICRPAARIGFAILTAVWAAPVATGQTPIEFSHETRFQLDVHVPDAALGALLPPGFTSNTATQGAAKDANLRVVFIDRVTISAPDGKPAAPSSNRLVYLVAPVKDPGGANAQLVVGGLTEDAADAPGPFGVYLPATKHIMRRTVAGGPGPIVEEQDWTFEAAGGEHLEMHIQFVRGSGTKGNLTDTRFYSAKSPDVFQISRQEQVLDILKNVTTNPPDRVKAFSFKAGGGSYAKLFDGTERLLSWDDILWINRTVLGQSPAGHAPEGPDVKSLGPQVGEKAPEFWLPDQQGQMQTLSSLSGPQGLVLVFNRSADW